MGNRSTKDVAVIIRELTGLRRDGISVETLQRQTRQLMPLLGYAGRPIDLIEGLRTFIRQGPVLQIHAEVALISLGLDESLVGAATTRGQRTKEAMRRFNRSKSTVYEWEHEVIRRVALYMEGRRGSMFLPELEDELEVNESDFDHLRNMIVSLQEQVDRIEKTQNLILELLSHRDREHH